MKDNKKLPSNYIFRFTIPEKMEPKEAFEHIGDVINIVNRRLKARGFAGLRAKDAGIISVTKDEKAT